MAGKNKFQESTNKSAQAGKKKDEGFQASADLKRIIPLGGGTHAYVLDPRTGLTHHLQVGSDRWDVLIGALLSTPAHAAKIQAELDKLGWSHLVRVEEAL